MPKFPDELSTRWLAAVMVPSARPRSMMYAAERSFMLPLGFISSSLAMTVGPGGGNCRPSWTSGVRPTHATTEL